MGLYHNDQPIQSESNDLLNRNNFSKHLAEVLLVKPTDDCLTVSLEGEWGYGKTSLINLAKLQLANMTSKPIIVEYNPWLAGKSESLIQDFLLQFSAKLQLGSSTEAALKASKQLVAYSSLFSVAKLIPGAEPWASLVEQAVSATGSATKQIAELKELDLIGKKKKVTSAINKLNSSIVVVIDDIDRLTPSETFEVLRLVKAVADFPGTSFLLAFDARYLTSVLSKNGIENSAEYINKVIQLRVPLPLISDGDLLRLAEIELSKFDSAKVLEVFENDRDRLGWIYHHYFKRLVKSPRDIKRTFNHLRFVHNQIEGQVCFADLFSLSILAARANQVYENIKKVPEAYLGSSLSNDGLISKKRSEIVDELEKARDGMLEVMEPHEARLIKGLIAELFPLTDMKKYRAFSVSNDDAAGRVSSLQRLHIALHYHTPVGYVSDREVRQFIDGEGDRAEFIERVIANGSTERFFELMMHYGSENPSNHFEILKAIYDVYLGSELLINSLESNYGLLRKDPFRFMEWLTEKVVSNNPEHFTLCRKIISRAENAPLSAGLLNIIRRESKSPQTDKFSLNTEQIDELESLFQISAIKAIDERMFLESHLESHVFYELKRSSKEKTKELISRVLLEEKGVIRVAEIIGNFGVDSTNGPYTRVDQKTFSDVIDIEILNKKAAEVDLSSVSVSVAATIKSMMDGESYYLRDGSRVNR